MPIQQVAVAENVGNGSITKILAFDEQDHSHVLYDNAVNYILTKKGKVFNLILEKPTPYSVTAVKLILNTAKIKGPNQIDAIGISQSAEAIKAQIKVASDAPKELTRQNLGKEVNSRHQEFAPIISRDGKTLYFTRNYVSLLGKEKDQDVWVTQQNSYGKWEKARNIGSPINNKDKNAIFSLSADGHEAILMNKYQKNGKLGQGISRSFLTKDGWSFPEEVKIDKFYNESPFSDFTFSPDGSVMVMSVQRSHTVGKRDLYVSFKKADNSWSEPRHMGNVINTAEHDVTPFIAADAKTLYYSTKGLSGFGDNDIFKTSRLDDTWQNWSEPENLGSAINTPNWDGYFTLPASGNYAYVCSYISGKKRRYFPFGTSGESSARSGSYYFRECFKYYESHACKMRVNRLCL
ncbi:hypothetical protein ACFFJX_04610 [Pseudarcicella hirudinis]|uniref:hypothetical protein n=1 Tax=Pseudarcicella hirudinis TaxID=1079859 RepID=UPI0035EAA4E5